MNCYSNDLASISETPLIDKRTELDDNSSRLPMSSTNCN